MGYRGARKRPRVLLGGLGMGYTLRAALDRLPANAEMMVVDLNPAVVAWCRGPLGPLTNHAANDRRVTIQVADVAKVIATTVPDEYDAILLDLYEGPHEAVNRASDPLYGSKALKRTWRSLRPGGVLGVWSEEPDTAFEQRLASAGFQVATHRRARGGRAHVVYIGIKRDLPPQRDPAPKRDLAPKRPPGPKRPRR